MPAPVHVQDRLIVAILSFSVETMMKKHSMLQRKIYSRKQQSRCFSTLSLTYKLDFIAVQRVTKRTKQGQPMIPFSQFSAGIPQSQFDFFRAVTAKAFASAERVVALNINTSRASVERSSNTVKQLMQLNDPRDLLSLTSQPQKEFQSLLAYSRELLSIVADVGLKLPTASAPLQPLPAPAAAPVAQAAPQPAPQAAAAPGAASTEPAAKAPVVEAVPAPAAEPVLAAVPEPVAEAKPVAKALSKVAPMPEAAERPLAAPVATQHEIELPPVKPVEAAPPPAPVSGTPAIEVRQAEAAARPKAARKK
jgi:hypothetical protein